MDEEITVVYLESEDSYEVTENRDGITDTIFMDGQIVRDYLSNDEAIKAQAKLYFDARRAIGSSE